MSQDLTLCTTQLVRGNEVTGARVQILCTCGGCTRVRYVSKYSMEIKSALDESKARVLLLESNPGCCWQTDLRRRGAQPVLQAVQLLQIAIVCSFAN